MVESWNAATNDHQFQQRAWKLPLHTVLSQYTD
jgi:hypothetical protein